MEGNNEEKGLVEVPSIIREVEAFVDEHEEEKKLVFYRAPKLRQFWGDEQEELESWKELYFDLIYVAMAFNLGKVLEELIDDGEDDFLSIIYFLAQFLPMYIAWFIRVSYLSRYSTNSYFHGLVDIIYALLLSYMALFIGKRTELQEFLVEDAKVDAEKSIGFNTGLGYSTTLIILLCEAMFRQMEVALVVKKYGIREDLDEGLKKRQRTALFTTAKANELRNFVILICAALSVIGAVTSNEGLFLIPLLIAFFTAIIFYILLRLCALPFKSITFELIPINVSFMLKRYGEFTILMLGEGVLQIIISDVDADDLSGHLKTFGLSFIILSCLFTMSFYMLPYEPHEHAFRKSSPAALIVSLVLPFTFSSIIGVGVALKLILKKQAKLDKPENDVIRRSFGIFVSVAVFTILLQRLCNFGHHEILRRDYSTEGRKNKSWGNVHFERILFSIFMLSSSFGFLLISTFGKLKGPEFLLLSISLFFFIFLLAFLEAKFFIKEEYEVENEDHLSLDEKLQAKLDQEKSIGSVRSSVNTNRKGCTMFRMLHFVRNKTKILDANLRALQDGNIETFDWKEDVEELIKVSEVIKQTFISFEKKKLEESNIE